MSFASDAYFYKGLEGLIGPPHPLLGEAIKRERPSAKADWKLPVVRSRLVSNVQFTVPTTDA